MSLLLRFSTAMLLLAAMAIVPACNSLPTVTKDLTAAGNLVATAPTPAVCKGPNGTSVSATAVRVILGVCNGALAVQQNVLEQGLVDMIPGGASASNLIDAGCKTGEAVCALAQSPTAAAWVATLTTTLQTKGAVVLPPPVAPSPTK
jgi:hypothetical protein